MQPQQRSSAIGEGTLTPGQERDDRPIRATTPTAVKAGRSTALQEEADVKHGLGAQPQAGPPARGKAHALQRLQPGPRLPWETELCTEYRKPDRITTQDARETRAHRQLAQINSGPRDAVCHFIFSVLNLYWSEKTISVVMAEA